MSSAFANKLSVRLFVQAAFTGLLATTSAHGSTWMMVTFVLAAAAAAVGAVIRANQANARPLVVGFEAVAVAVGVVGLLGGHYIPGTIVGVATLITVLGTHEQASPETPAMPAPMPVGTVTEPAAAAPAAAAPAPMPPAPGTPPTEFAPAARSLTILPGQ